MSRANLALALLACVAATFSFGPGIATFAAVFIVLAARRASIAQLAITVAVAVLVFATYSFWLPGSEAVSGASSNASLLTIVYLAFARFSAVFFELLKPALRDETLRGYLSIAVSAPVICLTVWVIVRDWMRGKVPDKLGLIGLGFFAFGGVTNTLIAVSRSSYFAEYPGQLYADRYLYWACCLWAGLAMYWAARYTTSTRRALAWFSVALMILFLLALVQATWWRSWSAAVYRSIERATVGIQIGIDDQKRLLDISEPSLDLTRQSIAAMQQAQVSIFGPPGENLLGQVRVIPAKQAQPPEVWVAFERVVVQLPRDRDVAMTYGALPKQIAKAISGGTYWLADAGGKVVGRCALSGASRWNANLWRYVSPTFNEIDCYTIDAGQAPLSLLHVRDGATACVARLMFF